LFLEEKNIILKVRKVGGEERRRKGGKERRRGEERRRGKEKERRRGKGRREKETQFLQHFLLHPSHHTPSHHGASSVLDHLPDSAERVNRARRLWIIISPPS
jgi:hypothetical protein